MVDNKQQSRLSGTYIRSLVKQLAYSSRTKDAMNPKDKSGKAQLPENNNISGNSGDGSGKSSKISQSQSQTQTHKKQVRRRLHTSRPYQERLLNMAEARREIVTALKQHRAAMKQASEQQKLLQEQRPENAPGPGPHPILQTQQGLPEQEEMSSRSKQNPNFLDPNNNYLDPFSCPYVPPPPPPLPPPSDPLSWPLSNTPNAAAFNFVLPNQPLGLNLNFQDFNSIIETSPFYHNPPILYSSPPSSSTSTSSPGDDHAPPAAVLHPGAAAGTSGGGRDGGLHAAVDEEEMAEMRTMGEKHEMEWNDTVNIVTSAWWLEFLKTVEPPELDGGDVFPAWLNPKEDFFLQQCLSDYSSSDDHHHDPALSCMEIGEIEGMDEDWLA